MIASKVIITQETRAKLNNPVLSPEKKRQLREELVKDYIRKNAGAGCRKQELMVAAGFNAVHGTNGYANGLTLVNSMIKRGVISHNKTGQYTKIWTINEDVKVTPTPRQVAKAMTITPKPEIVFEAVPQIELSKAKLVDMAKEFAWKHNSDSLREFIAHMENAVK